MKTIDVAPSWVGDLVGVPYCEGGCTMEGWSCWGPVYEAYRRRGIELPTYAGQSSSREAQAEIAALIDAQQPSWKQIPLDQVRLWDVVIMRVKGRWHCGLVLDPPYFLHCLKVSGTRRERLDDRLWNITGAFRYEKPTWGKVFTALDQVRVISCPHPLSVTRDRHDCLIPAGATIREHAEAMGWREFACAEAWLDDQLIPVAHWQEVVPKVGQSLMLRAIPLDQGNGKTGIRIAAMLAIVVAAAFTGGAAASALGPGGAGILGIGGGLTSAAAGAWGAGITATLSIVGSMAVSALIPAPRQLDDGRNAGATNPSYSITGIQNQLLPFGVVPQVLGRHRVFPLFASRPFSENVGDQVYFRALFTFGLGPLALSDMKIGETPLDQFQDVQVEVRQGYESDSLPELFPDDVFEEPLQILLDGNFQQRTTQQNTTEALVELFWPAGLWLLHTGNQSEHEWTMRFEARYRRVGEVDWVVAPPVQEGLVASGDTAFADPHANIRFVSSVQGSFGNALTAQIVQDFQATAIEVNAISNSLHLVITIPGFLPPEAPPITAQDIVDAVNDYYVTNVAIGQNTLFVAQLAPGSDGTGLVSPTTVSLTGGVDRIDQFVVTALSKEPFRKSLRIMLPGDDGQFDIQIRVASGGEEILDGAQPFNKVFWSKITSIQPGEPTTLLGQTLVALRIRASGQLNGTIDTFNAIAMTICKDWNGSEWVERPTNNPASLYRHVLQGRANPKPKPDARLDMNTIQGFHERCAAFKFTFNAVIDQRTTVRQLRQDVLAAGRGSFGLRDMLYSVVEDIPQPIPVGMITARNASDFKGTKIFVDLPHARKIRFKNEAKGYIDDERIIPLDGWGVTGEDQKRRDAFGFITSNPEATKFETVDAGVGVTNADQVWALERYQEAVAIHRSEPMEVQQDFESLRYTRGDRVEVNHDVLIVGLGSARVLETVFDNTGLATSFRCDSSIVMELGKQYGVRVQLETGNQVVHQLLLTDGEISTFEFLTPVSQAEAPQVGDLVALGEYGQETQSCLVKGIIPSQDCMARLQLVPYAPEVYTATEGVIPPFHSIVTLPAELVQMPAPRIQSIISDETVLIPDVDGGWRSQIIIQVGFPSGFGPIPYRIQARYRPTGSIASYKQVEGPAQEGSIALTDVTDLVAYDIMIRSVSNIGETSAWVEIGNYTVIGKTTPPPDVLTFLRDGEYLMWAYPVPPLDFRGFVLRRHFGTRTSWEDAQPIHEGVIKTTRYPLSGDLNVITYLLKAIDFGGIESINAIALTINLGDILVNNLLFTSDKKTSSFPGQHNGLINGSGNLQANTQSFFWSGNDTLPMWNDDADDMWVAQYNELEYITSLLPAVDKVPCTLLLDLTVTAQSYSIEFRTSGEAAFWSGTDANLFWNGDNEFMWDQSGQGWLPWLGRLDKASRQVYEWRLKTAAGPIQGIISKYQIKIDVPDVVEYIDDASIAVTTGSRLTLTKTYRAIVNVSLTLQNNGGTAVRLEVIDKGTGGPPLTGGPLVKAYNAGGAVVAALIDARVQGY